MPGRYRLFPSFIHNIALLLQSSLSFRSWFKFSLTLAFFQAENSNADDDIGTQEKKVMSRQKASILWCPAETSPLSASGQAHFMHARVT
jgi:hypothetical protein